MAQHIDSSSDCDISVSDFIAARALVKVMPPCGCPECSNHYRTLPQLYVKSHGYTKILNDSEAKSLALDLKNKIASDFQYLRDRCSSYGDALMQRWKKQSRANRQKVLLQASPALPEGRWDNYHFLCQDITLAEVQSRIWKNRNHLLNPFLSTESLTDEPIMLLSLIFNRTHYTPEEWAPYDLARHRRGWTKDVFLINYSRLAVVLYGPHYGSLIPWDREAAHRLDVVGFPRGQLLLECQAQLLDFLRKVADLVLEHADLTKPGSCVKWNEFGVIALKATDRIARYSGYTYQPFCAPPKLDPNRLLDATRVRLQAAEDQIWLLQTDPLYLQRLLKPDKLSNFTGPRRSEVPLLLTLVDIFWSTYTLRSWRWIVEECVTLESLHRVFGDKIQPGRPLPLEYELSLCRLELLLVQFMGASSLRMWEFFIRRSTFKESIYKNSSGLVELATSNDRGQKLLRGDRLIWCLLQLAEGPDEVYSSVDFDVSFAMLGDHLFNCSNKERARLDERHCEALSDYAVLNEILMLVQLHRPRAIEQRFDSVCRAGGYLAMTGGKSAFEFLLSVYHQTRPLAECMSKMTLSGPKDQSWVKDFDRFHGDSSAFWAFFRDNHRNWLEKMHWPAEDIDIELKYLSANLDPAHLKSMEVLRAEVLASLRPKPSRSQKIELQTHWGVREDAERIKIQEKPKIKTRPEAKAPDAVQEPRNDSEDIPIERIVVKKQSHAFFRKLFPLEKTDVFKQASWTEFTSAMASIGFSITHLEGSRVRFDKKDGGKIIFDEPHGKSTKIESDKMHAIKLRLTRRFGFTRDTFVLEE